MLEKVMPHNLEAEKSVIGAMFLSKYAAQKCVESLKSELFYNDANGKIFGVLNKLIEQKTPIDLMTVTAELDKNKILKEVGDVEYITEVINTVPTAANVDEYIKIVESCAIKRKLIIESTDIINSVYNSSDELTDLLENAERKILNVVKARKGTEFRTIQDVLYKAQQNLEKLSQTKGEITGLATGFYDLDRITSGLHANEFIIIAARPAMGKTAFALNVAINIAKDTEKAVAIFNMEMGAEQLAMRMLSSVGQINQTKLKTGRLEHNDWKRVNEAITRLGDTNLRIDDTPGMTIGEIRAKCRRLASEEKGLALVVIDYLQLISGGGRYGSNRQQEVSDISRALKTMAMELEVPVIALAQLSRSVEGRDDKRPILSDLRESGSIEQDADIVSFLYRDDYYNKESAIDESTSKSEFLIRKHRSGPTADIDLIFKRDTATFVNFVDKQES